jgi:hypothetical protein
MSTRSYGPFNPCIGYADSIGIQEKPTSISDNVTGSSQNLQKMSDKLSHCISNEIRKRGEFKTSTNAIQTSWTLLRHWTQRVLFWLPC